MRELPAQLLDGWGVRRLGVLAKVTTGGTPSRVKPEYWNGPVPWVTTGEIDFNMITSTEERITDAGVANSSAKIFPKGTVLMAMFGQGVTRGKVAMLGVDAAFNQACVAIVPQSGVTPRYLYHFLAHRYDHIRSIANTGSQANLNAALIRGLEVIVPPLPAAAAITRIGDTFDRLLDRLAQQIKARRKFKCGLLQQLLTGQSRFPEFRKRSREERVLGELFTERDETGRPDLPLLSITADRGIVPRDTLERGDTSSADKTLYRRIAPGDIGYNTMRMWQGVSALSNLEGIVSPAYTICTPGRDAHGGFFAHLFKFPPVVHLFWRYSQGLVDDTLNLKFHEFSQIRVTIPPFDEQSKIAALLDAFDAESSLLRNLHAALKEQKKGLMQKLLTGRIRVPASMLKEAADA
jgi:type I restriction enzyme, S subunit